jgi:hypothetical protein
MLIIYRGVSAIYSIIESVNRNSRAFAMSLGFTNNKPVKGVSVDISTLKENIKRLKLSEDLTSASYHGAVRY